MRFWRFLLLLLGAGLLGLLVAQNDPAQIFASIAGMSWRLGIVLCFPATLVTILDTLGWRFAFSKPRVSFVTLLGARLAGEAFNLTTPTAALGGEAVKAWLLRGQVAADESISSVIVAKTTIMIGQGLFLLFGVAVAAVVVPLDSLVLQGMLWLLIVEVVAVGAFAVAQTQGMLGWGRRLLERVGLARFARTETLQLVDQGLAGFYRNEPRRLALSIVFHFGAWLLGSLEAYLILRFLGVGVSLATATVIEAFGTAIRFATFLIPASLGALEGGYVVVFAALGLGPAASIPFGLARRVREFVWIGLGLVVFAVMRSERSTTGGSRTA